MRFTPGYSSRAAPRRFVSDHISLRGLFIEAQNPSMLRWAAPIARQSGCRKAQEEQELREGAGAAPPFR